MMMSPQQIAAVVWIINAIRPDWDRPGIEAAVKRVAERGLAAVAAAAIHAAVEPSNRTPAIIALAGDHWKPLRSLQPLAPPRPADWCPEHPGQYRDRCNGCAADRSETVLPTTTPANPEGYERGAALARHALTQRRRSG